jgi:hypothetical protein
LNCTDFENITTFIDPSCVRQDDRFDAAGEYIKTVCTYDAATVTKKTAASTCNGFGMTLADPENHLESLGVLITRANAEYPTDKGGTVWVGGEQNGLCSVLQYKSDFNYERKWVDCKSGFVAYCEFNSE